MWADNKRTCQTVTLFGWAHAVAITVACFLDLRDRKLGASVIDPTRRRRLQAGKSTQ